MLEAFYQRCPSAIKSQFITQAVQPKEQIISPLADDKKVYLLIGGILKISTHNENGDELIWKVYDTFELVGTPEVFSGQHIHCTVEAITACQVLCIPYHLFVKWLAADFEFHLYVCRLLSSIILRANHQAHIGITGSLKQRVADAILNNINENNTVLISKKILADIVGTSVRSLNRSIKELIEEDILAVERSSIQVLKKSQLIHYTKKHAKRKGHLSQIGEK